MCANSFPIHPALDAAELTSRLPQPWPDDLLPHIRAQTTARGRKLVVLDDDPTGTQTVHDVAVLTLWTVPTLIAELRKPATLFYILTNTRSLTPGAAAARSTEIGTNLRLAAAAAGVDIAVISRSDSTLRGHYPTEVDALIAALGGTVDATILAPFFLEGGRYTVDNVHYVAEGDRLVPAGNTQFAHDAVFGYHASDLRAWVEEKTGGAVRAEEVACISLDLLRTQGPDGVTRALLALPPGSVCVINALCYRDLEVFVAGLLAAEKEGKRYMYRTAASFVRVCAGLDEYPLLDPATYVADTGGVLFVVGSYVPKSTQQVNALLHRAGVVGVEVDVPTLLDETARRAEVLRTANTASHALDKGATVVIYTSRILVTGHDTNESLHIGHVISQCLVDVVRQLHVRPSVLIAKGGITSSDVATEALGVQRSMVLGQAMPGVPVWRLGDESHFPGMAYVVFPGNVGDSDALARLAAACSSG